MLFVPLCIAATGCATASLQRFEPEVRPARAPETIVVFEEAPARPYTVIARVDSRMGAVFQDFNDLRAKIIDQAARLGGDAVILGVESTKTDFLILTTGLIPMEKKMLSGDVIVFR
jgi:hypothetical protein